MTNQRKIVIHCHTGYCGMDSWEFYIIPASWSEDKLNQLAWECAKDNAESYGIYPLEEYIDTSSEEELDSHAYSENIEGSWYDYVPEEHDRYRIGTQLTPHFSDLT